MKRFRVVFDDELDLETELLPLSPTEREAIRDAANSFARRSGTLHPISDAIDEAELDVGPVAVAILLDGDMIRVVGITRREGVHGLSEGFLDAPLAPEDK